MKGKETSYIIKGKELIILAASILARLTILLCKGVSLMRKHGFHFYSEVLCVWPLALASYIVWCCDRPV